MKNNKNQKDEIKTIDFASYAQDEEDIKIHIENANELRNKTQAEFIAEVFKDKLVEIYLGDTYEDISVDQISVSYPTVFCGKVVGAYKECLIINSFYVSKNKITMGNMVFISERAIRCLNEVDGKGTLEDMFMRSKETLKMFELFKKIEGK